MPPIDAGTLTLRRVVPDDFEFVRSLAQDPRVTAYVGDGQPWSTDYFRRRFEEACPSDAEGDKGSPHWHIALTPAATRVGLLSMTWRPAGTEIGYWIAPAHWGQGRAGQLVRAAIAMCVADDPARPVLARVHPENLASRRVLERARFRLDERPQDTGQLVYRYLDA